MTSQLPISRLINTAVNLAPAAAQSQSLSSLLILGTSAVIDTNRRMRSYNSLTAVGADFGTTAPEYLAATLWFQQTPQPTSLLIGRWAQDAAAGQLIGAPLSAANTLISAWTGITTGSFAFSVDGTPHSVTGLNFTAAANLNGVAAVIDTAVSAYADCAYDASNNRFYFTSLTTGATSTVSFLSDAGSGADVSSKLGGRVSSSGAYVANGIAAETALEAAGVFDALFGQQWYALVLADAVTLDSNGDPVTTITNAEHVAIAGFLEATTTRHIYGATTQEGAVLTSGDTTNLAYMLKALGYNKSFVQYSSSNPYAVVSALARILTTDFDGNSTVITLMYKQEPGIAAETLSSTQVDNLESYNANVFVEYNNDTAIIERGTVASGHYLDEITGTDWLAVTIQTALYNLLYTSPTKIPQTDAGVHLLTTTVESVCLQGLVNGLLGPGTWTSSGFGTLQQNDFLPKGFYVYAPRVSSQSQAARAARESPTIQVAAKLAGAIHTIDVLINVNQ